MSTPLTWDELRPDVESSRYTVANLPRRLTVAEDRSVGEVRADTTAAFESAAAYALIKARGLAALRQQQCEVRRRKYM